jgi:3-dehydroquinate synthase
VTRIDDLGYPIVVTHEVPAALAAFVRERGFRRTVVLCDRNVERIGRAVTRRIAGAELVTFALGERRKTMPTLARVLDALANAGAERTTLVVGVGGGVAGDLFGFAAATYMRGVPFVNVATSLVAMVDAAVGGKTGIDLPAGKNLAGAFRDPVAVFCDLDALAALPDRRIREGLAEIVKHGVIEGGEAFESLEVLAPHAFAKWPWESVIADSIRVKVMAVGDDRVERGAREVLNLGHTFAHAIERVTGYRTAHGSAVAIGLRAAGLLALRTGRFSQAEHLRLIALLALLRLPLSEGADPEALLSAMRADKKSRDGRLRFVLPRALGDVEYGVVVPPATLRAVLRRMGQPPGSDEGRTPRTSTRA